MSDILKWLQNMANEEWEYEDGDYALEAIKQFTRLREENARLREALAPFVDAGHLKVYISSASTEEECWVSINIKNRDLRAAAAAIREGGKDE